MALISIIGDGLIEMITVEQNWKKAGKAGI